MFISDAPCFRSGPSSAKATARDEQHLLELGARALATLPSSQHTADKRGVSFAWPPHDAGNAVSERERASVDRRRDDVSGNVRQCVHDLARRILLARIRFSQLAASPVGS